MDAGAASVGELIGFLMLAVVVAGFIFLPDETKNIFIWLWRQTFGGGNAGAGTGGSGSA
ncbi:hypothetical protein [Mobilicoccus caccae]|uniref:Uncharacterized protein n=1 Tax=Mobilicoccus caccae TaxID=1859295 RepID=A0ABQ6IWY7_9MICO|nr:hypothetical protein [Mobilicoccus caccae]GMA42402.1 hypothetical protein GCM10025883_44470 [Mobilicoccus caccae]GMA42477.1 hypothetical protein GCM10025883_45220 [Mobilicoccus caccae]